MTTCSHCGYNGAIAGGTCPRCGRSLAPPANIRPTLILRLESPSQPSREWEITDQGMGIGRLDDSDIAVPDKSVSRQHARILPTSSGFEVEDLGSTNGTWLNDKQVVDRTALSNGDQLVVGDVPLRVVLRGAAPAVVELPPPPPAGGPSTVFYDLDDALAAAQAPEAPKPVSRHDVATSLDVVPARIVEQPTLVAAEPTPAPPPPTYEPRPAPPPEPAFEPRPAPPAEPAFEPRPAPPAETTPAPADEPTTLTLIELADRLATALRVVKGDTRLALWLFEQAGGPTAAQAFVQQAQRAEANPDNPIEQARLLDLAPNAARLLDAAVMLANVVSTFQSPDNEPQADAPNLEPVTRL